MSAESSPKIVIVDESPIRAAILEEGLREAGFTGVVHISEMQSLLARIYALDPDVILIDLENPSRDVLEQMFQVSRAVRRPIATREVGRELWTWLAEGANIYVCGDAKRMAKDVERALVDIVAQFGARTTDEAVTFVGELKKKGRFQQDVY